MESCNQFIIQTRMHSSRMRTARSSSRLLRGVLVAVHKTYN